MYPFKLLPTIDEECAIDQPDLENGTSLSSIQTLDPPIPTSFLLSRHAGHKIFQQTRYRPLFRMDLDHPPDSMFGVSSRGPSLHPPVLWARDKFRHHAGDLHHFL